MINSVLFVRNKILLLIQIVIKYPNSHIVSTHQLNGNKEFFECCCMFRNIRQRSCVTYLFLYISQMFDGKDFLSFANWSSGIITGTILPLGVVVSAVVLFVWVLISLLKVVNH